MSTNSPLTLVIDDEPEVRELICELLKTKGYNTEEARDGADAIERLKERTYSLIITDLDMPYIDGFKLLKYVENNIEISHRPAAIVITGKTSAYSQSELDTLNAFAILDKPFCVRELLALSEKAISREQKWQKREDNSRSAVLET